MSFKGIRQEGRTTGNKSNTRIKESFAELVENNLDRLQSDLDQLESKDRLRFIIDLAAYCIPKMRSVETSNEITQESFNAIKWENLFCDRDERV
jgi:hypothetical protein